MNGIIDPGTIRPALVVLGAGHPSGDGVVAAALAAGRRVVAVGSEADALAALRDRHADAGLRVLLQPVNSDADAEALAQRLRGLDWRIDGVVAAIARAQPCGRLLDEPAEVLQRTFDQDLLPHLFAARHLFPLLGAGSAGYVLVGGPGGHYPWAGFGHCSIAAAALRMMARVLHDEAAQHGLRVQLLAVDAPMSACGLAKNVDDAPRRALEIGRRALSLLDRGRHLPTLPIVEFGAGAIDAPKARPQRRDLVVLPADAARVKPTTTRKREPLPARDLRAARDLLDSLVSPLPPGHVQ